ncbi:hypothetical protein [Pseudomonas sp. DC3000-4b1]|uniref:hypothetical protein n=1 Tax=unclassified Pseudomonas TaxID=196821 RepID=UPI003CEE4C8F
MVLEDSRRALSYKAAVEAGLELQSYAWADVPEGKWDARLDFKVWSNNTAAGHLVCYFTSLNDGNRYRLSAFRASKPVDRCYTPKDGIIDFSSQGLNGQKFSLTVGRTAKSQVSWLAAELAEKN